MERKKIIHFLYSIFLLGIFLFLSQGCSKDEHKEAALIIGKEKISPVEAEKRLRAFGNFNSVDGDSIDRLTAFEAAYHAAMDARYNKKPQVENSIRSIIVNSFLKERLDPLISEIRVSREEIKDYYGKHFSLYSTPEKIRAAIIRIDVSRSSPDSTRSKLMKRAEDAREEALKLVISNGSLGSVAVKYSDDQSTRYRGGDTGWMDLDSLEKRFEKPVADFLKSGDMNSLSPVITGDKGFYIVKLMDRKKSRVKPLNKVRSRIRQEILSRKKKQLKKEFYSSLIRDSKIRVNRELMVSTDFQDRLKNRPPGLPLENRD